MFKLTESEQMQIMVDSLLDSVYIYHDSYTENSYRNRIYTIKCLYRGKHYEVSNIILNTSLDMDVFTFGDLNVKLDVFYQYINEELVIQEI